MTSSLLNRGEALPSPVSAWAIQFRGHDSEVDAHCLLRDGG